MLDKPRFFAARRLAALAAFAIFAGCGSAACCTAPPIHPPPAPTATPVPGAPTPTPSPSPVGAPTPTPSPVPTATPTPTPTPPGPDRDAACRLIVRAERRDRRGHTAGHCGDVRGARVVDRDEHRSDDRDRRPRRFARQRRDRLRARHGDGRRRVHPCRRPHRRAGAARHDDRVQSRRRARDQPAQSPPTSADKSSRRACGKRRSRSRSPAT